MKKTKTNPKVLAEAQKIGQEAYRNDAEHSAPCQSKALMELIRANDGHAINIMESFNTGKFVENEIENYEQFAAIFNRS